MFRNKIKNWQLVVEFIQRQLSTKLLLNLSKIIYCVKNALKSISKKTILKEINVLNVDMLNTGMRNVLFLVCTIPITY